MGPRNILAVAVLVVGTATVFAQSSPSFELNLDTNSAYDAMSVAQGDFNGDGKPDIVVGGGATSTTITLRLGNGDGTFQAPMTVGQADSSQVLNVVAADVNGDGKLDVVALCIGGTFDVFYGNSDGTFEAPVAIATAGSPRTMAVGSFYDDGLLDVAVGDSNGNIEIYKNVGGKAFALTNTIAVEANKAVLKDRMGDIDGDGQIDLGVLTPDGAYVLWGDGQGGFTQVLLKSYPYAAPADLTVGDLNQDGRADVIASYNCSANVQTSFTPACAGLDVFYGQASKKTLYRHAVTQAGLPAVLQSLAVDVNGDGIADLVAEPTAGSVTGVAVWLGHPDGTFDQTAQQFVAASGGAGGLVAGDWNRDGMMDFAETLPGQAETEILINGGIRAPCATSTISGTVTVCQPVDGAYLPSPVTVQANAYDTTTVTALQEYVDNNLVTSQNVKSFDLSLTEAPGPHWLVTKAWDASGLSFRTNRKITVYSGTPGPTCPAAQATANICLPATTSGSSPVRILANGATANVPTAAQLYVDGTLVINKTNCDSHGSCPGGTTYIDTTQTLAAGTHSLEFKLWDAQGNVYTAQKSITIQ